MRQLCPLVGATFGEEEKRKKTNKQKRTEGSKERLP